MSEHWSAQSMGGGVNQQIRLTMQPARPSFADALRIADRLRQPASAKWGGAYARRRVMAPESVHGLVSIMGTNGLYNANAVGTFGAPSAGQNWDRPAGAVHRWVIKLVDTKEVFIVLFSGDALFLEGDEIFEESFLVIISA